MISMPEKYKISMAEKLRNRSYMLVSLGVINQEAQSGAVIKEGNGTTYSYLSNFYKLFNNYDTDIEYVTLERDFFKTDGSMLFPPRPKETDFLYNVGVISENLNGEIAIEFDNVYDIRGLSIDFGEKYPVDFSVSNGTKTAEYTGNKESFWITEDIFDNTKSLLITPKRMSNGNGRLRVHKIFMGVGIVFENSKILSSEKSEYLSNISEDLPTIDFSLEVENTNRVFDVENKESAIHYLEIGQEVNVKYGYDVSGNGDIQWVDGCTCLLTDWEVDDSTMSFSATDKINYLDDIYYGGKYRENGISLYDLAVYVLEDAGLDSRAYDIDEYLKKIKVKNPLPCVTHKECLQLIANAGRCKMYVDRQGVICIKAAFLTVISPERMQVVSDDATAWSDLQSVVNGEVQYEYATMSQNHFKTGGTMYFLPRSESYLLAGFVSESLANASGIFAKNPKFRIILEAATSYYSLQLNFASNPAKEATIRTYYEGALKESYSIENLELNNLVEHEFSTFDTIEFEFTKGQPNSRVFVSNVIFGDLTDYRMDYDVMLNTPKGRQTEKISRVDITINQYDQNPERSNIFQQTIDFTDLDEYTFYFSTATYDVTAIIDESYLRIIDSSNYFVTVDTSGITGEKEIAVDGREYIIINKIRSKIVNPTGKIEVWDNPLIGEVDLADMQADWLGNYFANNVEYEISYRGEPRLDAGDILFLERLNSEDSQIQIYEHDLNFNGALSGTVKARRAVAQNE